jgi:hypothetical protein
MFLSLTDSLLNPTKTSAWSKAILAEPAGGPRLEEATQNVIDRRLHRIEGLRAHIRRSLCPLNCLSVGVIHPTVAERQSDGMVLDSTEAFIAPSLWLSARQIVLIGKGGELPIASCYQSRM